MHITVKMTNEGHSALWRRLVRDYSGPKLGNVLIQQRVPTGPNIPIETFLDILEFVRI